MQKIRPQEFVLVCSQGTFHVPQGESRIGSDAACQVCIHGDSVRPVHAYLRVEEGKLSIRSVESGIAADKNSSAGVSIKGKPVEGPIQLASGQEVSIGNVMMRVLASDAKGPSLWSRRWFRWMVGVTSSVAVLLLSFYCYVAFVVFSTANVQDAISAAVSTHLLRDKTEIGSVKVKLFEGVIELTDVIVKERNNFSSFAKPFIHIPSVRIKLNLGSLWNSGYRAFTEMEIVLDSPVVTIERFKTDGAWSIEDILEKYRRDDGKGGGLDTLDCRFTVNSGRINLVDNYTNIGETNLENIHLVLRQPPAGDPLTIEQCTMTTTSTPRPLKEGALKIEGSVQLFDQNYNIDSRRIASDALICSMENFDLAKLFEHFGYAWQPYRAEFKVVLGKPLNGKVDFKFNGLHDVEVNGNVSSESLISIREPHRTPLGNIPMTLNINTRLLNQGNGYVPQDLNLKLRGGSKHDPYLVLNALGVLNPSGTRNYTTDFECRLQDLLGTEVGKRLGLEGSMGGRLKGYSTVQREPSGKLRIDAVMDSVDGYVNILDPLEQAKPEGQRKPSQRQVLPLHFDFHANAEPNATGGISQIIIRSFKLSAPSFRANSEVDGVVKLGDKLEVQAKFILNLKGREFFAEFGPVLALFGFTHPIEEVLNLKVTVVTNAKREGVLSIAAEGTAARQWGADESPVQLSSVLDYDTKVTHPYLSLALLQIASDKGLPLDVNLRATCVRTQNDETYVIESINPDKSPLLVNSDMLTLRERFNPYAEAWLGSYDQTHQIPVEKSWLRLYRQTRLTGIVEQGGRFTIRRMLDSKALEPDQLDFDLTFAGHDFNFDMPLEGEAGRIGRRGQKEGRFSWSESSPRLSLKGSYFQRLSSNKEEPHRERLDIKNMDVNGRLGRFVLGLGDMDLFKLENLTSLPNLAWTDILASLKISGEIYTPAVDFLRGLGWLGQDDSVAGRLALEIDFDREKDALSLKKFVFRQDEQFPEFPLTVFDISGSLFKVRDISHRVFPLIPLKGASLFSTRLTAFFEEGGLAAMLDHLGDELSINQIQIETGPFLQWLERERKNAPPDRVMPAWIASLRRRDWNPEGTWKALGVKLTRVGDPKKRSWQLVGAQIRNDLSIFSETADSKGIRPAILQFTHPWKLQLGISLSEDNSVGLGGDIGLEDAFIALTMPRLKYEYRKLAKEPCKIELSDFAYAQGLLAQMGRLHLIGKPLELDVRDLKADWTGPAKGSFSVGNILLNGGPLPCAILVHKYEPMIDVLNMTVTAPDLNLQWLTEVAGVPPFIKGSLKNVLLKFDGSPIALQSMVDTSGLASRLKLDPKDPRLAGLNPERDRLNFDAELNGVKLIAPVSGDQTIFADLGGSLKLTARDLSFTDLQAQFTTTPDESGYVGKLSMEAPRLRVSSADTNLNLLRAVQTAGIPLDINGVVECKTPLSVSMVETVLHGTLGLLGGPATSTSAGSEERRFSLFEKLVASGTFKIPAIQKQVDKQIDKAALTHVEVQNFVMKNLKLSVPTLKAMLQGGRVSISDADYDLSKGRTVLEDGKPVVKGIGHSQKFSWMDADLALMFDTRADPLSYTLSGNLTAQHGSLKGYDFSSADRLSWEGAFKVQLASLSLGTPTPLSSAKVTNLPPWAIETAACFGESFATGFRAAIVSESANGREIWPQTSALTHRFQQMTSLAIHAYLAKLMAYECEKLEFQTVEPTVVMSKGSITVEPFQLIGKGSCEGLDLWVKNLKINLVTEAFNDDAGEGVLVYPVSIPRATRKRCHFDRWPSTVQTEYVRAITQGTLPLRISGSMANPVIKFPWTEVRTYGRRALFDMDKIVDLESLAKARQNFLKQWGNLPADIEAAAAVADRMGVGLPSTMTAKDLKESCIERVTGLPQSLLKLHSKSAVVISPVDSLKQLLYPEPDPPPVGPGVNPNTPKRDGAIPKKNMEKETR